MRQYGLPPLSLCNTITTSSPWGSFYFLFDISCVKHVVTYSIVNSFGMVFKVVIKYSYEDDKLSSKVVITLSFLIGTSKQASLIPIHQAPTVIILAIPTCVCLRDFHRLCSRLIVQSSGDCIWALKTNGLLRRLRDITSYAMEAETNKNAFRRMKRRRLGHVLQMQIMARHPLNRIYACMEDNKEDGVWDPWIYGPSWWVVLSLQTLDAHILQMFDVHVHDDMLHILYYYNILIYNF